MTTVTFFRSGKAFAGFRISGHTGFAEEGHDIVCAAVSALGQTALLGLTKIAGLLVRSRIEEAEALLEVLPEPAIPLEDSSAAQLLLQTLEAGIADIHEQYPGYVRVTYREWRK